MNMWESDKELIIIAAVVGAAWLIVWLIGQSLF